jgi:putative DNA primase/helicase
MIPDKVPAPGERNQYLYELACSKRAQGWEYNDIMAHLLQHSGGLPHNEIASIAKSACKQPKGDPPRTKEELRVLPPNEAFCRRRGVSVESGAAFGGYALERFDMNSPRFSVVSRAVIVPTRNAKGEQVGRLVRSADQQELWPGMPQYKELTVPGEKNGLLIEWPFPGGPVLIVEGTPDTFRARHAKWGGAVIGTKAIPSREALESIQQLCHARDVVLSPHPDATGEKWRSKIVSALRSVAASLKFIPPLDDNDLDDRLKLHVNQAEELARLAANALPCLEDAPGSLRYTETDEGNSRRFSDQHGNDIRYLHNEKQWLVWDGKRWAPDKLATITERAKKTSHAIFKEVESADGKKAIEIAKWGTKSLADAKIKSMIRLAQSIPGISSISESFDNDFFLFNTENGTIDLRTGELRSHDRDDQLRKISPVHYDPDATCPRWEKFLLEVFNGSAEICEFVRRWVGYSLTGSVEEQVFAIAYGIGSNGKSTFIQTISSILGEYAETAEFSTFIARDRGDKGPRNDIACLCGARFVVANESDKGKRFDEATLKSITGGDTVKARFLFQEHFEFIPQFKLFLCCNHLPEIHGADAGIWRRIRIIPFSRQFGPDERDNQLADKLREEAPGILAWAVRGCLEWQRDGLKPPPEVMAAVEEYKSDQDIMAGFLNDCCEVKPTYSVPTGQLSTTYETWCKNNGENPLKGKAFAAALQERGFKRGKAKGDRCWYGLKLNARGQEVDAASNSYGGWGDN